MDLIVIVNHACESDTCVPTDLLLLKLRQQLRENATVLSLQDGREEIEKQVSRSNRIILLLIESVRSVSTDDLKNVLQLCVRRSLEQRRRMTHVVKNFKAADSHVTLGMSQRAEKMLVFHDLQTVTIDDFISAMQSSNDKGSFSSPGESFAWQLFAGFLSYILPHLTSRIRSTLHDDKDSIRTDILQECGVSHVDPSRVQILPKYFMFLSEQIATNELSIAMNPQELFPGCQKLTRASSDLCLEFDSPGYKKRIPAYLMELKNPLTKDESTISHVIVFCGFAAPLFVMQKLAVSVHDKKTMFHDFTEELQFIANHPRSSEMLCQFSECDPTEATGLESSALQLIHFTDAASLECIIQQAVEDFVLTQSWCLVPKTEASQSAPVSSTEDLPLMSMAFAMAANSWIGFAQLLHNHIRALSSECSQLPLDLPYCFVIPKSGRFPDEAKLHRRFEEIGVVSEQQQFQVSGGRRYTFRVHRWKSMRISYEIPASVLSLRKQAECGLGGVRSGDLSDHLAEFRDALDRFANDGDGSFRVVEWDDAAEFPDEAWKEPSVAMALSLLHCLANALHDESQLSSPQSRTI